MIFHGKTKNIQWEIGTQKKRKNFRRVPIHFLNLQCVLILCVQVNVVAMLHNFWEQKSVAHMDGSSTGSDASVGDPAGQMETLILYESAASPGPPFVCFVTLPGGSCFGNYKVCH